MKRIFTAAAIALASLTAAAPALVATPAQAQTSYGHLADEWVRNWENTQNPMYGDLTRNFSQKKLDKMDGIVSTWPYAKKVQLARAIAVRIVKSPFYNGQFDELFADIENGTAKERKPKAKPLFEDMALRGTH